MSDVTAGHPAGSIPLDVADATPEWLTAVLGVPVSAVEVLDAHSGTTGRARLGVTYESASATGPASVFLKLAPFDERQRRFVDTVGLGIAEARFYRDVADEVPVRVPVVYHAALGDDGRLRDAARGSRGIGVPVPDDSRR